MFSYEKLQERSDYVDPRAMIALEEELLLLKERQGDEKREKWWVCIGDRIASRTSRTVSVNRKKYIRLALSCGWLCGSHRFYAGQKILGIMYLMFCWSGIPAAMTLIDLMIILPMEPDEDGRVTL